MEMKRIIMRNASLMKAFCCTYANYLKQYFCQRAKKENNMGQWDIILHCTPFILTSIYHGCIMYMTLLYAGTSVCSLWAYIVGCLRTLVEHTLTAADNISNEPPRLHPALWEEVILQMQRECNESHHQYSAQLLMNPHKVEFILSFL